MVGQSCRTGPDCRVRKIRLEAPAEVWLRIENQALVALPETRGVIFGIRLEIVSPAEVKRHPAAARGLARALRTMPDAMAEYKFLLAARTELLRLLEE